MSAPVVADKSRCHLGHSRWVTDCSGCANAAVRRHAPKRDAAVRHAAATIGIGFREFCRRYGRSIYWADRAVAEFHHPSNQKT